MVTSLANDFILDRNETETVHLLSTAGQSKISLVAVARPGADIAGGELKLEAWIEGSNDQASWMNILGGTTIAFDIKPLTAASPPKKNEKNNVPVGGYAFVRAKYKLGDHSGTPTAGSVTVTSTMGLGL